MGLYAVTDWLGLVPLVFIIGFALLGLVQWIQRKHLLQVDRSILVLGGFYLVTMAAYLLFETVIINYRPVLIQGFLEASYPSSHTMIVVCIMTTAIMLFRSFYPEKKKSCMGVTVISGVLMAVTVIGRLISGVHWFTDIVGGALLSAGLVMMYYSVSKLYMW